MATRTVIGDLDGISAAEIRAGLVLEEQPQFDESWRTACLAAAETLDLDEIVQLLQNYRVNAAIVKHYGVDDYWELKAMIVERLGQTPLTTKKAAQATPATAQ